jgi:hypothetical protein
MEIAVMSKTVLAHNSYEFLHPASACASTAKCVGFQVKPDVLGRSSSLSASGPMVGHLQSLLVSCFETVAAPVVPFTSHVLR